MTSRFALALAAALCLSACAATDSSSSGDGEGGERVATTAPPPDATHGDALPEGYRSAATWKDETEGDLATLVYVSASGSQDDPRPYPVILSSDPSNTYFHRENSVSVSVRRLYKGEMRDLLARLRADGFDGLPWEDFGLRERIGPARAFYLYQGGACRRVLKDTLDTESAKAFTRVENRLIAFTSN
jgi:hypothetical protein